MYIHFYRCSVKALVTFASIKVSKCEKMFKFNFITTEEENKKENDSTRDEPKLSIESQNNQSKN